MRIDKNGDQILERMNRPILERLLRAAPPGRLRAFAIACARLAGSVAELHRDGDLLPLMRQTFAAAELLAAGVEPKDSRVLAGREAAGALAHDLDEIQLQMHGWILDDTEDGRYAGRNHPLLGTYAEATRRYAAADAAAFALHEDPLTAAALCLEVLDRALCVDYDTLLVLARHWLNDPAEPAERDAVPTVFGREGEE